MHLGELAPRTGFSVPSIRRYEDSRLPPADRTVDGYREFDDDAPQSIPRIKQLLRYGVNVVRWRRACDERRARMSSATICSTRSRRNCGRWTRRSSSSACRGAASSGASDGFACCATGMCVSRRTGRPTEEERVMDFKDTLAIVTSGGTAIDRAVALRFAADGANVLVTGRRAKAPKEDRGSRRPDGVARRGRALSRRSSTYDLKAEPAIAHYAASTVALEHLTHCWALKLEPKGVRVNAVAPGPTETPALSRFGHAGAPRRAGYPSPGGARRKRCVSRSCLQSARQRARLASPAHPLPAVPKSR